MRERAKVWERLGSLSEREWLDGGGVGVLCSDDAGGGALLKEITCADSASRVSPSL